MRLFAVSPALLSLLIVSILGCGRAEATSSPPAGSSKAPATAAAAAPVAQVVFVDKENCCECTQKRTDATWKELKTALGSRDDVEVLRVHLDTQPDLAKEYVQIKPVMVPPGLYFMSAKGDLVEMLQGELTASQISGVLARK